MRTPACGSRREGSWPVFLPLESLLRLSLCLPIFPAHCDPMLSIGVAWGGGGSLLCYVRVREPSCFLPPSRERDTIACLCDSCLFITSGFGWGCLAKSWSQSISPKAALSACVQRHCKGRGQSYLRVAGNVTIKGRWEAKLWVSSTSQVAFAGRGLYRGLLFVIASVPFLQPG